MKRETGVAFYFWGMLAASLVWAALGEPVASAVMATGAGVLGGINLMARDYFNGT